MARVGPHYSPVLDPEWDQPVSSDELRHAVEQMVLVSYGSDRTRWVWPTHGRWSEGKTARAAMWADD